MMALELEDNWVLYGENNTGNHLRRMVPEMDEREW